MLKTSSWLLCSFLALSSLAKETKKEDTQYKFVPSELFKVDDRLEVTLWASSPLLFNPTNMDVDSKGNIWVTEGVRYRRKPNIESRPEGDRIVVVRDTNGDGKADKSHTFVQDPELVSPLGIAVFDNKILVSQPPNLYIYTDVDRNMVFDAKIDKKEILLSGFNGKNHDHSLHATVSGPDGRWYINQGNCAGQVKGTDGRVLNIGGQYYQSGGGEWPVNTPSLVSTPSADGELYHGGFIAHMNPDGSDLQMHASGFRNSYENCVNSLGEVFQSDNDDTRSCRMGFVPEYGNAGYYSRDGKRYWRAEKRHNQEIPSAHWHQLDPGFMDAGDIYGGGGGPTGTAFYENGALPKDFIGTFLGAEASKRSVFSYKPKALGAGYELKRDYLVSVDNDRKSPAMLFRPSDVMVGADGAIYICDWYDPGSGGHSTKDASLSGAIYRIAPKGFKSSVKVDYSTLAGQVAALANPANNVRFPAFQAIKNQGEAAYPELIKLLENKNPWIAARAIWLLPYLGKKGLAQCQALLKSDDANQRLVAFRALRRAGQDYLTAALALSQDSDARILRAVAESIHLEKDYEKTKAILLNLYSQYNANDKALLEAIGTAANRKEEKFWQDALALETDKSEVSAKFTKLTWRLMAKSSIPFSSERVQNAKLKLEDRIWALESLVHIHDKSVALAFIKFYQDKNVPSEIKKEIEHWTFMRSGGGSWDEFIDREEFVKVGILEKLPELQFWPQPEKFKPRKVAKIKKILKLKGNAKNGKTVAAACKMCHYFDGNGANYGPGLDGWAKERQDHVTLQAIIYPEQEIAHGYYSTKLYMDMPEGRKYIHGIVVGEDSRYLSIMGIGGVVQKVPVKDIHFRMNMKKNSMMFYPEQLGLTKAQDFADLTAYLKTLKSSKK